MTVPLTRVSCHSSLAQCHGFTKGYGFFSCEVVLLSVVKQTFFSAHVTPGRRGVMSEKIMLSYNMATHLKALGVLRDEEDTLARRINKIHGKLQTTG